MILYIGNILSSKRLNPPPIESIKGKICDSLGKKVILTSNKKNKFLRFLHMNFVYFWYFRRVSLVFLDVYSTKAFYYTFYFAYLSKVFSLKYIPVIHGGDIENRIKKSEWMTNFVFKNGETNITPSIYIESIFKKYNFDTTYIPNCIEFSKYKFKLRKKIRPKIMWLRSFHEIYNPKMALEVLKILKNTYNDAKLTMVGPEKDGSLEKCLRLSKRYKLNQKVEFVGYLSKIEWLKIARDHDIFINTSTVDNMPVSILEMMALGLPIISTNVGGIPCILKNKKNSLLVNNNDFKSMASSIKYLINDPEYAHKISMNALNSLKPFSVELVVPQWIKIIKTVLI